MLKPQPGFEATAEQVSSSPQAGQIVRIIRRCVSHMPDFDPPYYVTWEYEVIEEPVASSGHVFMYYDEATKTIKWSATPRRTSRGQRFLRRLGLR